MYTCAVQNPWASATMNREDHFYSSPQLYKDPCPYQRPQSEDFSQSPPPCLYMGRQSQPVYASPSVGTLDQTSLPDIASYSIPMREDPCVQHLQHHQAPAAHLQPVGGYGDPPDLCVDRNRYHLPFPWMKSTKSHAHTWKGQWAGKNLVWLGPHVKQLLVSLKLLKIHFLSNLGLRFM